MLDAPELADDFYLNLVDWSSTNVLGVGLGSAVYLWAVSTAAVSKMCDLSASGDTISRWPGPRGWVELFAGVFLSDF